MKRLITSITVLTVIPSILIGVYQTVMEQNFVNFLNSEFTFSDTQVVKSSMDVFSREVSVSLVGTQLSDEVIEMLERALPRYNLADYMMYVTQNNFSQADNSEMVTVAVQRKTIQELQAQMEDQHQKIEGMEAATAGQIDCKALAENVGRIFTKLSDCSCGIMSDAGMDYVLLCASADGPLLPEEEHTIQNWLGIETGRSCAEPRITEIFLSEESMGASDGS